MKEHPCRAMNLGRLQIRGPVIEYVKGFYIPASLANSESGRVLATKVLIELALQILFAACVNPCGCATFVHQRRSFGMKSNRWISASFEMLVARVHNRNTSGPSSQKISPNRLRARNLLLRRCLDRSAREMALSRNKSCQALNASLCFSSNGRVLSSKFFLSISNCWIRVSSDKSLRSLGGEGASLSNVALSLLSCSANHLFFGII
jgi:hypothetical protein